MKLFPSSVAYAVALVCLCQTAHGQVLSTPSTQLVQGLVQPMLAAIPGPFSVPLGVIGGIGALLLLRPRRGRR